VHRKQVKGFVSLTFITLECTHENRKNKTPPTKIRRSWQQCRRTAPQTALFGAYAKRVRPHSPIRFDGIDLAKPLAPEHAALIDDLKDQLLIVFMKRLGSKVSISVSEIDDTSQDTLSFKVVNGIFHFVVGKK
jgi:hypothetical protein